VLIRTALPDAFRIQQCPSFPAEFLGRKQHAPELINTQEGRKEIHPKRAVGDGTWQWYILLVSIMRRLIASVVWLVVLLHIGCSSPVSSREKSLSANPQKNSKGVTKKPMNDKPEIKLATFGGGCFWCTEAIFQRLNGVVKVEPGYSGGHVDHPTYEQVCTGTTGHAESIQISYDASKVAYDQLLEVFWKTHDPTTLNRQGVDVGTQYRSVVFYHDPEQKRIADGYKAKLDEERIWDRPIVTEIVPFAKFWPAEDYHHNYYNNNSSKNNYCSVVITPKIEKFKKIFKDRLKLQ
jgi:peptide-methionine (S)-S-oxide reductase